MGGLSLRNKSDNILSRPKNPELRATCSVPQIYRILYEPPLMQACKDYLNTFQHGKYLYNLDKENNNTELIIYNTETRTRKVKTLQTSQPLDLGTCITQLPNGKLFCLGNRDFSGITVLIDTNGGVEVLQSGTPCSWSSCIYFNNNVYCFGGYNEGSLTLSSRFDLEKSLWIKLTPMPNTDIECSSIMLNRNILISGCYKRNLLLYSIDIDSFSTIPYKFTQRRKKILINAERLYLIECDYSRGGDIYESEIGSYTNWRPTGKVPPISCFPFQMYRSYNEGYVYIGISGFYYFKFDLNEKSLIALEK